MTASIPSSWERRNIQARAAGWTSAAQRQRFTRSLSYQGMPLRDPGINRAREGFLYAINQTKGVEGKAAWNQENARLFAAAMVGRNMNRTWGGQTIASYLEERGIIGDEDDAWAEFWTSYKDQE